MELSFIEKIINRENLYWAWEKTKHFYKPGDVWFDEIELAGFEANLESEFKIVTERIENCNYKFSKIRPIGFPKAGIDSDGNLKTRQTFWISIRDQFTWIAVLNIIGPYLDAKMPFWSYGNRLYISVFPDEFNPDIFRFGHYRNTSRQLLRRWHHSWPMFRRHIAITIKRMTNQDLDDKELRLESNNKAIKLHQLHCDYLNREYWSQKKLSGNLYWASIDFSKFYPSANIEKVKVNILKYLPQDQIDSKFVNLIEALTKFELNIESWNQKDLKSLDLIEKIEKYNSLPTGLFAAHFLANVLLMDEDSNINQMLRNQKNLAHFRYVDDHIILCDDFDDLINWIKNYETLLNNSSTGAAINLEKTEPKDLQLYLEIDSDIDNNEKLKEQAKTACKLDPDYPTPLMTQTLAKISKINETEFELLDLDDKERFISEIEHLLLAEFNDQEIRKDTRLSYAASILTKLVPKLTLDNSSIVDRETKIANIQYLLYKNLNISENEKEQLRNKFIALDTEASDLRNELSKKYHSLFKRTFNGLLKVVYENFDKVRLWSRALEFCANTGYHGIDDVFSTIGKLKKEKRASDLTLIFIESIIFQVLAELSLKAKKTSLRKDISESQKTNVEKFLNYVNKIDLTNLKTEDTPLFYHKRSFLFLTKTIQTIKFLDNSNLELNYKDITNPFIVDSEFSDNYNIYESAWIWFYNSRLTIDYFQPSIIWSKLIANLEFNNNLDFYLTYLYPKYIPVKIFDKIERKIENEGWIFDFIKTNVEHFRINLNASSKVSNVIRKSKEVTGFKTIYDWNEWLLELENIQYNKFLKEKNGYFDPRMSEWTALEIVSQVIKRIIDKEEDIENINGYLSVHPNNFLIPISWMKDLSNISWHQWDHIVSSNPIFENSENLIFDERFTPAEFDPFGILKQSESNLLGIGALLTCLLAKDFSLPANWNPQGHQRAWLFLIYTKLQKTHVSTFTKQILNSIFSKRNKETQLLELFFPNTGHEFVDDTSIDPPVISNLKEL